MPEWVYMYKRLIGRNACERWRKRKQEEARSIFSPQCRYDTYERREGRREDGVGRAQDCRLGPWGNLQAGVSQLGTLLLGRNRGGGALVSH